MSNLSIFVYEYLAFQLDVKINISCGKEMESVGEE